MQRECIKERKGIHFFKKNKDERYPFEYKCEFCSAHWIDVGWALRLAVSNSDIVLGAREYGSGISKLTISSRNRCLNQSLIS